MKRRLKNFDEYKSIHENYASTSLNEFEDDLVSDELVDDTENLEDTADDTIESDIEDEMSEEGEGEEMGEEGEEDSELKMKINSIIEENYKESLKDIFNGLVNSLEEEEGGDATDLDDVIDYALDSIEKCMEEFATSPEEDAVEDDMSEEGEGEERF